MIRPTQPPVPAPPAPSLVERAGDGGDALRDERRPGDLFARFWIVSFAVALLALTASERETRGTAG
jgi:hypothetical protein